MFFCWGLLHPPESFRQRSWDDQNLYEAYERRDHSEQNPSSPTVITGNQVMGRNETSWKKNDMTGLKLTKDCWPTMSPGNLPSGLTQIEKNNQDENQ